MFQLVIVSSLEKVGANDNDLPNYTCYKINVVLWSRLMVLWKAETETSQLQILVGTKLDLRCRQVGSHELIILVFCPFLYLKSFA